MQDNVFAVIIFVAAIAGLIALVVYKMRKTTNQEVTIEGFLDIYYQNLFGVIQDVVSLLSINVEDFETKEEYERTIISTTIAKLEENCDEFGISAALFRLVDRQVLTDVLYDILYTNKVQIFFSSLTEKVVKAKPELYDKEVIEAFENADPLIDEDDNNHDELQEEPVNEEEEIAEQTKENIDVSDAEADEEAEADDALADNEVVKGEETTIGIPEKDTTDNEYTFSGWVSETPPEEGVEESTTNGLPPREAYYGEPKKRIEFNAEDLEGAVLEIYDNNDDFIHPEVADVNKIEDIDASESLASTNDNDIVDTTGAADTVLTDQDTDTTSESLESDDSNGYEITNEIPTFDDGNPNEVVTEEE